MELIKKIFIYTNIWIAIGAVLAIYATATILHLPIPLNFYGLMCCATLCSYSLHWYFTPAVAHNRDRENWSIDNKNSLGALFVLSAAGTAYFAMYTQASLFANLLPLVFYTFIYTAPKLPFAFSKQLQRYVFAKTIYLAIGWTYATVVLPILCFHTNFTDIHYQFMVHRFALILVLCGLFDYRDRLEDSAMGIQSMIAKASAPIVVGVIQVVLAISILANVKLIDDVAQIHVALNFLPILVLFFIIKRSMQSANDMLFYGLLDGLMFVNGLVCLGLFLLR
jgi:hypothetical protein